MNTLSNAPWPRGCLEVYTGDGKGKTTAALGLALRAAGRGQKVFIGQFMKLYPYGELESLRALSGRVVLEQFGSPECIPFLTTPDPEDVALARAGLLCCKTALLSGEYAVVILDEINVAVHFKLLEAEDLLALVDGRPPMVELVCTGRYACDALLERADLVTEMRCVKHYFDSEGLPARDGIER